MEPTVRIARSSDVDSILRLYDREIAEGYATFKTEPSDPEVWRAKVEAADPFLVADLEGLVIGIAYASAYRPRPAYHRTRETSIFLAPEAQGRGLGTRMYADLLDRLRDGGAHTALAMVSLPNEASLHLHHGAGFAEVGVLREVGDKLGRLIDVAVLQCLLEPTASADRT